jgi:predicted transglutaminase-like cysteine proteinase
MRQIRFALASLSAAAFFAALPVQAAKAQAQPKRVAMQAVPAGGVTTAPIGWVDFCERNRGECDVMSLRPTPITLDDKSWREIVRVNNSVNNAIEPITDMAHHGVMDHWSYPADGKGDCEDYVLEKRRRLVAAGYPRQALLITVVRDHKGDGHAVLTVVTDRGDFVLDNQATKVMGWDSTGYRYIKRQSQEHPNRWISLGSFDTATTSGAR